MQRLLVHFLVGLISWKIIIQGRRTQIFIICDSYCRAAYMLLGDLGTPTYLQSPSGSPRTLKCDCFPLVAVCCLPSLPWCPANFCTQDAAGSVRMDEGMLSGMQGWNSGSKCSLDSWWSGLEVQSHPSQGQTPACVGAAGNECFDWHQVMAGLESLVPIKLLS